MKLRQILLGKMSADMNLIMERVAKFLSSQEFERKTEAFLRSNVHWRASLRIVSNRWLSLHRDNAKVLYDSAQIPSGEVEHKHE